MATKRKSTRAAERNRVVLPTRIISEDLGRVVAHQEAEAAPRERLETLRQEVGTLKCVLAVVLGLEDDGDTPDAITDVRLTLERSIAAIDRVTIDLGDCIDRLDIADKEAQT